MNKPIIEVKNLSKKYTLGERQPYYSFRDTISGIFHTPFKREKLEKDEFWALKDVSFDISQGDVVGIIGRNGAGKSTLLKVLSQITSPTEGFVKLRGRVASLLEVGTGFHPELTGRENIFLNGAILGMKRWEINNKFNDIADFAEIQKFLDTPVKRYSSGMYMRLAFSVAAHLEPEILIVDEVLAVGDSQFQKKCLGKMDDIAKKDGRTIIFVSHNLTAIKQLCKRGIILSKGEVSYVGTANMAVDQYINTSERRAIYLDDGYLSLEQSRDKIYISKVFKKIRILDKNNTPSENFTVLDSMKIDVELENNIEYPDARYCIAILTQDGQWVTSSDTGMYLNKNNVIAKNISFEIPTIRFPRGKYQIYLSMSPYSGGVYVDKIEDAAFINVESGKNIFSGNEFSINHGFIIPDNKIIVR